MNRRAKIIAAMLLLLALFFGAYAEFNLAAVSAKQRHIWYDSSYLSEPITNTMLSLFGENTREVRLLNHIRTEEWLVRETEWGDKVFWTVLERKAL